MSEATCSRCGKTFSIRSLFDLNGVAYCEPCVQTASQESRERRLPSIYVPLITKSICARCNTYLGDSFDSVPIGNLRFCSKCASLIKDWGYPQWLKLSLAALLLLLIVALVHGRKYFHAGREMYVGERLVKAGRYGEALPHLQETIRLAPGSDKGVLLFAKAALLSGDVERAGNALQGHNSGYFEDASKPEVVEVDSLWKRATSALEKADEADKLANQDGKEIEAARLMHEAATTYPELPGLAFAAESLDEGVAFVRKDYDTLLAIAQKQWKEHPMAQTAAGMASALACKFAVTGDASYRQQSEEMLERARRLANGNTDALKNLDEFAERNRYRLETRKVISKTEFDRRFRSGKTAGK